MNNNIIFVFGSNRKGIHGKGAALYAKQKYGAEQHVSFGRTGNAFAIPTKLTPYETLPLSEIKPYVNIFINYAKNHKELIFLVTRIGCGLAGYKNEDIAPMFENAPDNCILPAEWLTFVTRKENEITIELDKTRSDKTKDVYIVRQRSPELFCKKPFKKEYLLEPLDVKPEQK